MSVDRAIALELDSLSGLRRRRSKSPGTDSAALRLAPQMQWLGSLRTRRWWKREGSEILGALGAPSRKLVSAAFSEDPDLRAGLGSVLSRLERSDQEMTLAHFAEGLERGLMPGAASLEALRKLVGGEQ